MSKNKQQEPHKQNEIKTIKKHEDIIEKKRELTQYLYDMGVLWSYRIDVDTILSDKELIVTSLTYLDLEEMDLIFDIFPYKTVRQIWIEEMLPSDYDTVLNKMLAYIYFGVKNFNDFRKKVCGKKEEKITNANIDMPPQTELFTEKKIPLASPYQFVRMPEGWKSWTLNMLHKLNDYVVGKGIKDFTIRDMGEKLGHGYCKTSFYDDAIHIIIEEWSADTYKTCCRCGNLATKYTRDWIRPYCDKCFPKNGSNNIWFNS